MRATRRALVAGAALLLACAGAMAQPADKYPDKPVRLVVPFPPGGPTDVFARVLSVGLAEQLGQQILIENKGGAGGTVGTELVARSKPDGYTLLFGTAATHGINISLYKTLPYDPLKDFELVALTGLVPMVLLVPPDQPHTLKELVAKLKTEPGNHAVSGPCCCSARWSRRLVCPWVRRCPGPGPAWPPPAPPAPVRQALARCRSARCRRRPGLR